MWRWLLPLLMMQDGIGVFHHGVQKEDHGVSISVLEVQSGPRCRHYGNCPWMIQWASKKKAESVEIAVTLAGRNVPEVVVTVPGSSVAPLDKHNPVFQVPLGEVYLIEFTLKKGTKEIARASFK